jgi:hypothetical protein
LEVAGWHPLIQSHARARRCDANGHRLRIEPKPLALGFNDIANALGGQPLRAEPAAFGYEPEYSIIAKGRRMA